MKKVLIIGATSAIAQAAARLFAAEGDCLFLVARDEEKLRAITDDLASRGATMASACVMDALDYGRHRNLIDEAESALDGLDAVLIAHGTLPDQHACEQSFDLTKNELEINCLSTLSLLTHLANYFERKKSGTIAVISSVAGIRGRQSNYVYGTAKGAVSIFLQGLRNRLHKSGVRVIDFKPGFVDTPMTAQFRKGLLWASPDRVARDIHGAIGNKDNVVYVPRFWRWIMLVIRLLPERQFKKLKL